MPLANIDALPDALLARVLVLAGRKRCPITSAVCRRWRRLVFAEPRLWGSVILSPGLLPQLAKKKDKQHWFSSQHALLRRIASLVEAAAIEGGSAIEAAGAATGKWGLTDLLSALEPSKLLELSIQGPWELPAATLRALGRLSCLTCLELDSYQLPEVELLAALGQLTALQTLKLRTHWLCKGLPHTLAQLSRLQQLHLEAYVCLFVEELLTATSSLTSLHLAMQGIHSSYLPCLAAMPALRQFCIYSDSTSFLVRGGLQCPCLLAQ